MIDIEFKTAVIEFDKFDCWRYTKKVPFRWDYPHSHIKYHDCMWTGQVDRNGDKIYEMDVRREEIEHERGDQREYYVCIWIKEWSRFAWLHLPGEYQSYQDHGVSKLDHSMQETFGIFENESSTTIICGNLLENPDLVETARKNEELNMKDLLDDEI